MSQRFENKVVIVTGAAGDIGSATARRFATEGARVVAVDFDSHGLQLLSQQILELGACCLPLTADVSDEASVKAYVEAACEEYGGVDVLFNNAGVEGQCNDIAEYDVEDFDRVMAVNVRGVLLGMKYAVPRLRVRGGGAIVNTSSVAGLSGAGGLAGYSASKHAVIGLTRSVALQQGENNIRVNAVCPSAMSGRMMTSIEQKMDPANAAAVHDAVEASIPLGRYALPGDVASMIMHLCSDESAFLTGGVYTVDGGFTA